METEQNVQDSSILYFSIAMYYLLSSPYGHHDTIISVHVKLITFFCMEFLINIDTISLNVAYNYIALYIRMEINILPPPFPEKPIFTSQYHLWMHPAFLNSIISIQACKYIKNLENGCTFAKHPSYLSYLQIVSHRFC